MGCTDGAHFARVSYWVLESIGRETGHVLRLDIGIINPRGASNSTYINAIPGRRGLTEYGLYAQEWH